MSSYVWSKHFGADHESNANNESHTTKMTHQAEGHTRTDGDTDGDIDRYYQQTTYVPVRAPSYQPHTANATSAPNTHAPLFEGDSRYEAVIINPVKEDRNVTAFSIPWSHIDKRKYYALMPVTNIGVRLLTYPFNLIKTRMSAFPSTSSSFHIEQHVQYKGTFHAMRNIIKEEGFFALYKGLGISCLTLLTAPIYLTILETSKAEINRYIDRHPNPATTDRFIPFVPAAAGGIASIIQQFFAVPLDVITQRMMVSRGLKPVRRWPAGRNQNQAASSSVQGGIWQRTSTAYSPDTSGNGNGNGSAAHGGSGGSCQLQARTPAMIVRDIMRTQGWRGLYRGFYLSVAQYTPFSAICWQVNASLDPALRQFLMTYNPLPGDEEDARSFSEYKFTRQIRAARADGLFVNPDHTFDKPAKPKPLTVRDCIVSFISGGVSGMVACLATTPIDVIKTRMQVNESHMKVTSAATLQSVIRERGLSGLMAGTSARMLAVGQSSAMLMVSYEVLKRYSLKHELYASDE
jgi:hypothetical protein